MTLIAPRFDFRIECAAAEDLGRARRRFEDAHLLAPERGLFVVADGMGGHPAGDVASRLAVEAIARSFDDPDMQSALEAFVASPRLPERRRIMDQLRIAVVRANEVIRADAERNPERKGMGTTLDAVVLLRRHAFVAHAGDGRVYLHRSRAMLQLTQDHDRLERMKADNLLRPTAKRHRTALINAVGISESVTADTLLVDLNRGDRLLLCTDGIHAQIEGEGRIGELLRVGSARDAAASLVRTAARKGLDNATALVIEVGERFVKRPGSDRSLAMGDLATVRRSALLHDMSDASVLAALSVAVEVEAAAGESIPKVVASDLVAYIVIEGVIRTGPREQVGAAALLFPESLVGTWDECPLPVAESPARLLRLRADDFREVCQDPRLGAQLYRRLAVLLARLRSADRGRGAAPLEFGDLPSVAPPSGIPEPSPGSGQAVGGRG